MTLTSLWFGSQLLDYAGQKFETAPELVAMWRRLGPRRPKDELWWNEWDSQVTYPDHSRLSDLMDGITGLRSLYQREWRAEYTDYRLGTALGRWDDEYLSWKHLQERLKQFSESSHAGDPLPSLEELAKKQH